MVARKRVRVQLRSFSREKSPRLAVIKGKRGRETQYWNTNRKLGPKQRRVGKPLKIGRYKYTRIRFKK